MAVQATIVLDSGAFLINESDVNYLYSEVGYFEPRIVLYNHKGMVNEIKLAPPKKGSEATKESNTIEVRYFGADDKEKKIGIKLTDCLVTSLLRVRDHLYDGDEEGCSHDQFDYIFRFYSGIFRSSKVKPRDFKELDKQTLKETKKRKPVKPIAHDVTIDYDLKKGESLRLFRGEKEFWSSLDPENKIKHRFDIEILADHSTALKYYCDAVSPKNNKNYWVPNQGDPPPHWRHSGSTTE